MEKEILETIGKEERKAFKEEHEVRANGYYQRDLLAPMGAMEDLQVPRVRTGDFHPCFLEPHERHLFKLEELIYAMYAGGFSRTLEALLESKYSPQRVSFITQKALEKAEAFRKRKIEIIPWENALAFSQGPQVVTHHLCGWYLPQGEEGRDSGRGGGLLSFGDQRGGIKGGAHLLPCFFRGERGGLERGLSGLKGAGFEGTPALYRGWAHRTPPCRKGDLPQS